MPVLADVDIRIRSSKPAPEFADALYRVADDYQQDITPASTRRSDGDARYRTIETESFWGQTDWSGGFGLVYPPDPTSYQDGPVDAMTPNRLRAGFECQVLSVADGQAVMGACRYKGEVHLYTTSGVSAKLYKIRATDSALVEVVGAGLVATTGTPICLAEFRGKLWMSFGNGNAIRTWDGTAVATPTNSPFADRICPFGSMLFTLRWDATTLTHRINRYDPENTGSVPDLAILPFGLQDQRQGRSLVALGQDLYVCLGHQLWRFTSTNGNSGVLQGPLDDWVPSGGPSSVYASCSTLRVFRGGLYYSAGSVIRRYYPGGSPETVFPDPVRDTTPGAGLVDDDVWALEVAQDRLWAVLNRSALSSYTTEPGRLLMFDGVGFHHAGSMDAIYTTGFPGVSGYIGSFLSADHSGRLVTAFQHNHEPLGGGCRTGWYALGGQVAKVYHHGSVAKFSKQDYGLLDIEKGVSEYGIAAIVPSGCGLELTVAVDGADQLMVQQGSFPIGALSIVYYLPPGGAKVAVGKVFEPRVRFTMPGNLPSQTSAEVWSLFAIPNPLNPLRRGFRFTILIDQALLDYSGQPLYPDAAAVADAVAAVRSYRDPTATRHPLALRWVDGLTYYVRINTQTVSRYLHRRGTEPGWKIVNDAQEIS